MKTLRNVLVLIGAALDRGCDFSTAKAYHGWWEGQHFNCSTQVKYMITAQARTLMCAPALKCCWVPSYCHPSGNSACMHTTQTLWPWGNCPFVGGHVNDKWTSYNALEIHSVTSTQLSYFFPKGGQWIWIVNIWITPQNSFNDEMQQEMHEIEECVSVPVHKRTIASR